MTDGSSLRVLVVQMGARRSYELARMMEAKGALAALQTGAAWHAEDRRGVIVSLLPISDGARARRTVTDIPSSKLRTTLVPEVVGVLLQKLGLEDERRFRIEDWLLGRSGRYRGLAGANVVLNTTGNGGLTFLRWAKLQGAKIATDIVITPLVHEIVANERARWPGWEPIGAGRKAAEIYRRYIESVVAASDLLLCPSDIVVDGLSSIKGFASEKVAIVPYTVGYTVRVAVGGISRSVCCSPARPGCAKGSRIWPRPLASCVHEIRHTKSVWPGTRVMRFKRDLNAPICGFLVT